MTKTHRPLNLALAAGTILAGCAPVWAQFSSNFEAPTYSGAATGVLLTTGNPPTGIDQDGWFNPVAGSQDAFVYTYAGNTLGVAANPLGGAQFEGGATVPAVPPVPPGVTFVRAQHAVDFSAGGIWELGYDVYCGWTAALPAGDNIGSFSLQPSAASRFFQTLLSFGATAVGPVPNATLWTATADHFHMAIGHATAVAPATTVFDTPSAAYRDLPVAHWYRVRVRWDFLSGIIMQTSLQDLTACGLPVVVDVSANGWILIAPAATIALPTNIRMFTGGGGGATVGSLTAWDNVSVAPSANRFSSCYANCDSSTILPCLNVQDFGCFLNAFAGGNCYANCDNSTIAPVLNVQDFGCFLNKFAAGCSDC